MQTIKKAIIDWLGISHMAADVYGRLLKEHEAHELLMRRDLQNEFLNEVMARIEAHEAGDQKMLDHFASCALQAGKAPLECYTIARQMLEARKA